MVLHPAVVVRDHPKGSKYGRGLFAAAPIAKGEVVWLEDHEAEPQHVVVARDRRWIEALPPGPKAAYKHFVYQTGEDEFESLPEFDVLPQEAWAQAEPADVSMYMNHSCDPTTWFEFDHEAYVDGPGVMTARRDIAAGEELTFDYATSEGAFDQPWVCCCGSTTCRGTVRGCDWKRADLQERYEGHFMPYLAARISTLREQRRAEAECVERWGVTLMRSDEKQLGRYLVVKRRVPKGADVMVLPPNRILRHHEVDDFERILTVRTSEDPADTTGALYSYSQTPEDLDNFMAHSCDPTCEAVIDPDTLCVTMRALRDIPEGGLVSFDYETTETDMVVQGCSFTCNCGARNCKGHIVGFHARQRMEQARAGPTAAAALKPPACSPVPV